MNRSAPSISPWNNREDRNFLIWLFLGALVLRLAYCLFLRSHYFFYDHPSSDVLYYQHWADDILGGGAQARQAFWGLPLYPYFLALLKSITLSHEPLIKLIHLIIGSINCCLGYRVAKKISNQNTGKLTGLLMAVSFTLIHYDWLMMPVTILITLSLSLVDQLIEAQRNNKTNDWLLAGVLAGILLLGDGKFFIFLFLFVIALPVLMRGRPSKTIWQAASLFLIPLFLILGMVTARNKLVANDWVLVSAQSGLSFYVGNNPQANSFAAIPDFIRPTHEGQDADQKIIAEQVLKRPLTPSEISKFWRSQAFHFIKENPGQWLMLVTAKARNFFIDHEGAYDLDLLFQRDWKKWLDINSFSVIVPLALIGITLGLRAYPQSIWPILLITSQLIFTMIFFLTDRHRATILPFLIFFEAFTLCWLTERIRGKEFKKAGIVLLIALIVWLLWQPVHRDQNSINFLYFSKAGAILEGQGKPSEARAEYIKALRIYPNDAYVLSNLGNTYAAEENYPTAIVYYQKALSILPNHVDALYNMAFAYEQIHDLNKARELYSKVLELDPASHDAALRLQTIDRTP